MECARASCAIDCAKEMLGRGEDGSQLFRMDFLRDGTKRECTRSGGCAPSPKLDMGSLSSLYITHSCSSNAYSEDFQLPRLRKLVDLDALIRRVILLYAQATIQRASGAYTLRASSESGAVEITTSIVVIDGCEWRADTSRPIARREGVCASIQRKKNSSSQAESKSWHAGICLALTEGQSCCCVMALVKP